MQVWTLAHFNFCWNLNCAYTAATLICCLCNVTNWMNSRSLQKKLNKQNNFTLVNYSCVYGVVLFVGGISCEEGFARTWCSAVSCYIAWLQVSCESELRSGSNRRAFLMMLLIINDVYLLLFSDIPVRQLRSISANCLSLKVGTQRHCFHH